LAAETRGLALVARREGSTPRARISRLLLLSDDGAERLYRHAEGLTVAHAPRVLVAVLTAGAAALGRATTARDAAVKVVLVKPKPFSSLNHLTVPVVRIAYSYWFSNCRSAPLRMCCLIRSFRPLAFARSAPASEHYRSFI